MSSAIALDLRTVSGLVVGSDAWPNPMLDRDDFARDVVHALPEGMHLLDYEIVGPIGESGFGVVYLAWDHSLEQHVAIKEYLPAALASRASCSPAVVVRSKDHADRFRAGLRGFIGEAELLSRFEHPALVRVLHFWEGNGTAYMAMPYYEGPTLARALVELGHAPDEALLCNWLHPLLDALGILHAAGCLHCDIAPDNILITDDGPVLLDFGAARRVIEGLAGSPMVTFKPGFAPIEQYAETDAMKQGPWTDLYGLAGVAYAAIAGQPPVPSAERLVDDRLRPLAELARDRYSGHFLEAIDAALSLHPDDRPRDAAEFWGLLSGARERRDLDLFLLRAVERPAFMSDGTLDPEPLEDLVGAAPPRRGRARLAALAALVATGVVGLGAFGYFRIGDPALPMPPPASRLAALPAKPVPTQSPAPAAQPTPVPAASMPVPPMPAPSMPAPSRPEASQAPLSDAAPEPVAPDPVRRPGPRVPPEPARSKRPAAASQVGHLQARCVDVLQRASLGSLAADEAALLRKGC